MTPLKSYAVTDALEEELKSLVAKDIGKFAKPDVIQITPQLPKTRSGKIMRRILRCIVNGKFDEMGDVSTLADPSVVEEIKRNIQSRL